ncbi:MAG: methyltransferase domain-containing protein [Bacteroidota bacterium]
MHLNSKLLFERYALSSLEEGQRILEIGATGYPSEYAKMANIGLENWYSLDIEKKHIGDAGRNKKHILSSELYNYPIDDCYFDIVLAGQVIEHVADIWIWLIELKRITKKGGKIIIICPVSWPYHEAPIDCWRIYPEGFKVLAKKTGLILQKVLYESLEAAQVPKQTPTYPNISSFKDNGVLNRSAKVKNRINGILQHVPLINRYRLSISVAYDSLAIFVKNE